MGSQLSVSTQSGVQAGSKRRTRRRFTSMQFMLTNSKAVTGFIILGIFLLIAVFAPLLAHYKPMDFVATPWQSPSGQYWLGTTDQGQDVWSQWVLGTRTSMFIGVSAGFISTIIAVLIGVFAGYKGGAVDTLLNGFTNIMIVLPGFPLLIVIASYVPESGPLVITLILSLTGWYYGARTKRAQALTFRSRDFIVAARLSGKSDLNIVFTEVMPNMLSFIFNNFMFASLGAIGGEAGLEFLGIGSPMNASWGNMLNWADRGQALLNGGWWWFVPPGLSIALVALAFNLINYAIDDLSNPRLRKPPKEKKSKKGAAIA